MINKFMLLSFHEEMNSGDEREEFFALESLSSFSSSTHNDELQPTQPPQSLWDYWNLDQYNQQVAAKDEVETDEVFFEWQNVESKIDKNDANEIYEALNSTAFYNEDKLRPP